MPENLYPPAPADDAPVRHELRITLRSGGVDEIGHECLLHLCGYVRALLNHGLISPEEADRQGRQLASCLPGGQLAGLGLHHHLAHPRTPASDL